MTILITKENTMKTVIRKTIMALACLLVFVGTACADNDEPITVSQLPVAAQTTLKQYFKGKSVALVTIDRSVGSRSYDVVFGNGEKIEFDRKGNWTDIDCRSNAVPARLIPSAIASYVKAHHAGAKVVKIERDKSETDVKLSNGIELTFNKKYQLIDID